MSLRMTSLVWEKSKSTGSLLVVELALADYADDMGNLWPSMSSIAKKTRLSEAQARRHVHRMIRDGMLSVRSNEKGGAPGRSRHYVLTPIADETRTPIADETRTPIADETRTPIADDRNPSHGGAETPLTHESLTVKRTVINSQTGVPFQLPSWIRLEAWQGFEAMRTKLKKPMTARAMLMIVKTLEKMKADGEDPNAVLEQSELKCWTNVYPVKSPGQERQVNGAINGSASRKSQACGRCGGSLSAGWTVRRDGLICNSCEAGRR